MSTTQEDLVTVAGAAHIMSALADENGERANRQEQIETVLQQMAVAMFEPIYVEAPEGADEPDDRGIPDEIVDQAYTQIQKWAVAAAAKLEKILFECERAALDG